MLIFTAQIFSQNLPDKIVVIQNTYTCSFENNPEIDSLMYSYKITITNLDSIKLLVNELNKYKISDKKDILNAFDIDTLYIKKNYKKFLSFLGKDNREVLNEMGKLNKQQKEFIFSKLSNIENYKQYIEKILSLGNNCFRLPPVPRKEYIVIFYNQEKEFDVFTSQRYNDNRYIPYISQNGYLIYNDEVDYILDNVFGENYMKNKYEPLRKNLLKYIINDIFEYEYSDIADLETKSYLREINELKTDFKIVDYGIISYSGGSYIINEGKNPLIVKLKNSLMLPNVYIEFIASKIKNTFYSRDFLKKDYENILNKVQSIKFIVDFLKENPNTVLKILYFDNKCINFYHIKRINGEPQEWQQHDKRVEMLKKNDVNKKDTIVDEYAITTERAIKTSESLYCGCNFRFDKDFLEQSIIFELSDKEKKYYSLWCLLPDNRVLLYFMQGEKVLNYNYNHWGNKYPGVQEPCVIFDLNGEILNKK